MCSNRTNQEKKRKEKKNAHLVLVSWVSSTNEWMNDDKDKADVHAFRVGGWGLAWGGVRDGIGEGRCYVLMLGDG